MARAVKSVVEVSNLNKSRRLNVKFMKGLIKDVSAILKIPRGVWLEVIFLNDRSMRILNRRYKKADRFTDVLSFHIDTGEFTRMAFLGEILISSDRAFHNSRIFKTEFCGEIVRYVIHGILHLFGYDDVRPADKRRMSEKEEEILKHLCRRKDLSKVLMPR